MKSMKHINLTGSAFSVAALLGPSTRALIPRGIWVALLAMVLVGMSLWPTPASTDGEEAGEPVWSADMTVVKYTSVSIGAASADLFSNVGGSGNLQIKSLWSHIPDRDLRLAFADEVPNAADYTLKVSGLSLEFPADSSDASSFKWQDVDVDWEDGQLIRVRIVLTSEIAAPQANTPATGVPAISGTAQVGETLAAETSGIADEDGLDSVSYHYQWMRTDTDIADATDSTYTLTDDDQGQTIKLMVSFIDDNGNSETLTSAATAEVSKTPQFLVSNLGVGVEGAGGIQRTLSAARSGFAQAFTTGAKTNGYAVGAVDIQVSHFYDASNTADQLRVTINGVASEGEPDDAHCILTNPSSFTPLSVITFEAPAGAGSCPQLAAETTYFVVIEWISPTGTDSFAVIPQTYPTKESAAIAEDPGGAEGWSIADNSYYLSVSSDARTWTEYDEMASFKIKVKEGDAAAAKANSPATGVPTISGTVQVGETLTADTSAITDEDGLENVSYSYQWIRSDDGADTDIAEATDSTYTLADSDAGKTIKVRVSFTDDADNEEFLTSADTDTVAATKPGVPGRLNVFPHDAEALDVYWEAPASDGGSDITGYKVQWKESADSWDTPADVSEETASGTIHTITELTDGVEYSVRVLATNGVGDSPPSVEKTGTPRETKAPEMVRPRLDGATLKVLYDEALDEGSAPPTDSFDVRVACTCDDTTWLDEEAKRAVESVSVDGDTVVLTLVSAATSEDVVVVSYTPPSEAATARTRDLAGNVAAGFNPTEGFNDTDETAESEEDGEPEETTEGETPLTVSLEATTESHNGTDAFTFEIRFSEEFPLSYKTLRDLAFTVSGGEILKAQRLDKPSNIRWLITVETGLQRGCGRCPACNPELRLRWGNLYRGRQEAVQ